MDVELLARIQFAVTIGFHYIYPPLSIGLGVILVIMEGMYLKTKKKKYEEMTRFWVKVFALTFAMGVATGIVMEFEFGTNWASYSRFVGDVFGSALAAEGIFAFFLESGFLAVLVFGWDKVKPRTHFISTIMVAGGAHLSALWILIANSWMQTPAGHHIVGEGIARRAEIVDFWALVFNPSTMDRLSHTLSAAWLTGAFLVLSVSAYYLLKKKHIEFAKSSIKIALVVTVFASFLQLGTGHSSAKGVAENQPAKLAAFEGHYETKPADLYLFGWVDNETKTTKGLKVPNMLTFLIYGNTTTPVKGLNEFAPEDRPPVNIVFQTYHAMVAIGMTIIGIGLLGLFFWKRKQLEHVTWFQKALVLAVILPQLGNQLGWMSAEIGRQPWIVYNIMRTKDALSKTVDASEILFSLIMFSLIYILLFILFIFLLDRKIKHGPDNPDEGDSEYAQQSNVLHNKS